MKSGCQILSRGFSAEPAASVAPTRGPHRKKVKISVVLASEKLGIKEAW